jgi:hypothetical protein
LNKINKKFRKTNKLQKKKLFKNLKQIKFKYINYLYLYNIKKKQNNLIMYPLVWKYILKIYFNQFKWLKDKFNNDLPIHLNPGDIVDFETSKDESGRQIAINVSVITKAAL